MLSWIAAGAAAYVLVCLCTFFLQDRLIYFPGGPPATDPSAVGLAFEERFAVTADGLRLHAWWIPSKERSGTVLVSHGNAGNIGDRLHLARSFRAMGFDVLLYDYRGYGRSEGRPSEEGTYLDAEAAWQLAVTELGVRPDELVLYGESLGAAVAIELARRRPAAALVAESAFTSIADVGARAYPFLPVRLLARHHYASIEKIAALELPLLLLHSPEDELVPFEHAEHLRDAASGRAELVRTTGGHNDGGFSARSELAAEVARFLAASLERARRTAAGASG